MRKQIFIINGSAGVGKDSFVSLISEISNRFVMNFSSVDEIKEIAYRIGWSGKKTEKDRKFLSDLKLLCTNYNDMPFNSMKEKVEVFAKDNAAMLFLHIREPEEIEKARVAFSAKTILVKRDAVKQITSNMADGNVFNYTYDIVVNNDGDLENLKKKAVKFVDDFNSHKLKTVY